MSNIHRRSTRRGRKQAKKITTAATATRNRMLKKEERKGERE